MFTVPFLLSVRMTTRHYGRHWRNLSHPSGHCDWHILRRFEHRFHRYSQRVQIGDAESSRSPGRYLHSQVVSAYKLPVRFVCQTADISRPSANRRYSSYGSSEYTDLSPPGSLTLLNFVALLSLLY